MPWTNRRCVMSMVAVLVASVSCVLGQDSQNSKGTKATPATAPSAAAFDELAVELAQDRSGNLKEDPKRWSREQLVGALQTLTDDDLNAMLNRMPFEGDDSSGFEFCLNEVIRRGGPHWEQVIKARYDKQLADDDADKRGIGRGNAKELLLLTALRRTQKRQDPLVILVEGKARIEAKLGYLPEISANLTNLDPEKLPVTLWMGGDYRGASRHNKWRIQLFDEKGRALPERQEFDTGGFLHSETLEYRESFPLTLSLGSYVSVEKPGTYTMRVLFHPVTSIGNVSATDELLCCTSIPMTLVIEPITVELTAAEQASSAALILKLPRQGPVHILGGGYDEKLGDFMPKDSPAGQLKQMEWKAVPELIAAVNGEKLTPVQRAWALGLLFSITDQRNPMDAGGVVGPFEYRHSGWTTFGGGPGSGQSLSRAAMSMRVGEINEQAQRDFAQGWKAWIAKGYIKITEPEVQK